MVINCHQLKIELDTICSQLYCKKIKISVVRKYRTIEKDKNN